MECGRYTVTVAALSACGGTTSESASGNLRDLPRGFTASVVDHELASSPAELSQRSDLVVVGRMTGVQPGPVMDPDSVVEDHSVVFTIEVEEGIKGSADPGTPVHLLMWGAKTGDAELEKLRNAIATKPRVVLFAVDYDALLRQQKLRDADAGRPEGAPVYYINTPLGLQEPTAQGSECLFTQCSVKAPSAREVTAAAKFEQAGAAATA